MNYLLNFYILQDKRSSTHKPSNPPNYTNFSVSCEQIRMKNQLFVSRDSNYLSLISSTRDCSRPSDRKEIC